MVYQDSGIIMRNHRANWEKRRYGSCHLLPPCSSRHLLIALTLMGSKWRNQIILKKIYKRTAYDLFYLAAPGCLFFLLFSSLFFPFLRVKQRISKRGNFKRSVKGLSVVESFVYWGVTVLTLYS